MEFRYEPELLEYMKKKNKMHVLVELITSESSDFDLTELCPRILSDRMARFYVEDRGYKVTKTEVGEVLLPDYRLEYDAVITFGMKKWGPFKKITQTGIRL